MNPPLILKSADWQFRKQVASGKFADKLSSDPRVSGQGIARLNKAGIRVSTGIAAEAAADVNAGLRGEPGYGHGPDAAYR